MSYALFKDGVQIIHETYEDWCDVFDHIAQPRGAVELSRNGKTLLLKLGYEINQIPAENTTSGDV